MGEEKRLNPFIQLTLGGISVSTSKLSKGQLKKLKQRIKKVAEDTGTVELHEGVNGDGQNGKMPVVKAEDIPNEVSATSTAVAEHTNLYDDYDETKPSTSALSDDELPPEFKAIFARFQTADVPSKAEGIDEESVNLLVCAIFIKY